MHIPFLTPLGLFFLLFILFIKDKIINFVGGHPLNIPTKLGSNWRNGFREED